MFCHAHLLHSTAIFCEKTVGYATLCNQHENVPLREWNETAFNCAAWSAYSFSSCEICLRDVFNDQMQRTMPQLRHVNRILLRDSKIERKWQNERERNWKWKNPVRCMQKCFSNLKLQKLPIIRLVFSHNTSSLCTNAVESLFARLFSASLDHMFYSFFTLRVTTNTFAI